MKIKICGLRRIEDITYVNLLLPDYIGFVFADSKRRVDEETAAMLKERLDHQIRAVGVFVNEKIGRIKALSSAGIIDIIQLHGTEDDDYIREIKSVVGKPVIKAVRVRTAEDIREAELLACDYLLLDAYAEAEAGGSGKQFDHTVIPPLSKPFFLAGGLHEGNVEQAIRTVIPYAVDVSSGVEELGVKSFPRMEALIKRVKSVNLLQKG